MEDAANTSSLTGYFTDESIKEQVEDFTVRRARLWECIEDFRNNHYFDDEKSAIASHVDQPLQDRETFKAWLLSKLDAVLNYNDLCNPDYARHAQEMFNKAVSYVDATKWAFHHYPPTLLDDLIDMRMQETRAMLENIQNGMDLSQLIEVPQF